ncbi:MAG TPA: HicB family protein [Firmicutes bacterium]|nr:HicB family protein [Bacillota bacterium]
MNNTYFYPAIFSKEKNVYNVKFIDFDDIYTFGNDLKDAFYMAQDALYNMLPEYAGKLPVPTENYMNIKLKDGEFISMVILDVAEHERKILSKTVKTTVTMPEWLKTLADSKGINFSKLLQESLKRELNLQ